MAYVTCDKGHHLGCSTCADRDDDCGRCDADRLRAALAALVAAMPTCHRCNPARPALYESGPPGYESTPCHDCCVDEIERMGRLDYADALEAAVAALNATMPPTG